MKKSIPKILLKVAQFIKQVYKKAYFKLYRFFKSPNFQYLAIGESKNYSPAPHWTLADIKESDLNINFEEKKYNFNNLRLKNIYSSHCIEHLSDSAIKYLFEEIYKNLQSNGVFRVETPDALKIINDYKCSHEEGYLREMQKSNKQNLVLDRKMGSIYGKKYIALLGLISCYVDKIHIPVICSKETFDEKLSTLPIDEFCLWAISLQTEDQLLTHGHINFWYFKKLKNALLEAGFREIRECKVNETFNNFDLSLERSHRSEYSVIVEAIK